MYKKITNYQKLKKKNVKWMVFKKIKMKNPKKSFKCLDFSKEK
jgi:hypothetical protein